MSRDVLIGNLRLRFSHEAVVGMYDFAPFPNNANWKILFVASDCLADTPAQLIE